MPDLIADIVTLAHKTGDLNLALRRTDAQSLEPYALGFRHGKQTGAFCSRRQAEEYFSEVCPNWTDADYERYLNGRDYGVSTTLDHRSQP